jgi:hypothetical protein
MAPSSGVAAFLAWPSTFLGPRHRWASLVLGVATQLCAGAAGETASHTTRFFARCTPCLEDVLFPSSRFTRASLSTMHRLTGKTFD